MIYLFLQSVVPTVPAGWLTFAEAPSTRPYDTAGRGCGGISVTDGPAARRGDHEDRRRRSSCGRSSSSSASSASPPATATSTTTGAAATIADRRDRRPRRRRRRPLTYDERRVRRVRRPARPRRRVRARPMATSASLAIAVATRIGRPGAGAVASRGRDRRPPAAHRPRRRAGGALARRRRPGAARRSSTTPPRSTSGCGTITAERDDIRAPGQRAVEAGRRSCAATATSPTPSALQAESRALGETESGRSPPSTTRSTPQLRDAPARASPTCPTPTRPTALSDADNPVVKGPVNLPDAFPEHQRVPHWETATALGILDNERATKISGAMFTMHPRAWAPRSAGRCASSPSTATPTPSRRSARRRSSRRRR